MLYILLSTFEANDLTCCLEGITSQSYITLTFADNETRLRTSVQQSTAQQRCHIKKHFSVCFDLLLRIRFKQKCQFRCLFQLIKASSKPSFILPFRASNSLLKYSLLMKHMKLLCLNIIGRIG